MKVLPDFRVLTAFLFILSVSPLHAQISQITLNSEIDGVRITDRLTAVTTYELISPPDAWEKLGSEGVTGSYNFGFTEEFHWVGLTVTNQTDTAIWLAEIENPHINVVHLYYKNSNDDEWIQLDETGRAAPYSTRRVAHFNFVLPIELEKGESADLLLMLDKRRSSISYHINLWSIDRFNEVQQVHYAAFGIYFGMFLLILFITGIAWFMSFNKLYLSYLLYVLSVGLFVFNDTGLGHQYIYPWSAEIGCAARIALTYAMIITFLHFTQYYFNTNRYYPKINLTFNVITGLVIIHGAIYYLFTAWFQVNATLMITLLYSMIITAIGTALYTAILYLKKEKYVALLFVGAFAFIFLAGFIFIFTEFGFLPEFQFLFTPIQIGSALEIMFLSFGLAWRVRVVERDQIQLNERISRLKTEKLVAYIEGSEEERNRVAMDLHDSIGNRLGNLKRLIESGKQTVNNTAEELKQIISDVRAISHKLAPPSMNLTGVENNISLLVKETNELSTINYSFQSLDIPGGLPEDISIQLYRIVQEAIQNIEKHSRAENAAIQLIGHPGELVLTIEDDGAGMESPVFRKNGIGLDNIQKRVHYLGGSVDITSAKNRGVQLLVSLPLTENSVN